MKNDIFVYINQYARTWGWRSGITVLLVVLSTIFTACPAERDNSSGDTSPPAAPFFKNIGKSITWVANDGAIFLRYSEPKDRDFDHIEITAIPVHNLDAKKLTRIVKKGSSEHPVIMQGFTQYTQYRVSVVAVDKASNKSTAMTSIVSIGIDTTPPDKHGLTIMLMRSPNSLVFTWAQPQDKSIQKLKIILKDKGRTIKRTETVLITEKRIEMEGLKENGEYIVALAYMDNNGIWEKNPSSLLHNKTITLGEPTPIESVQGLTVNAETQEQLTISWTSPAQDDNKWVILDVQEVGGNAVGLLSSGGRVIPFNLKRVTTDTETIEGEDSLTLELTASAYGIVGSKAYKVKARVYDAGQVAFSEIVSAESGNMKDGVVNSEIGESDITLMGGKDRLTIRWKAPEIIPTAIRDYWKVNNGKSKEEAIAMATRVLPDFGGVRLALLEDDSTGPIKTQNIEKGVYKYTFKKIDTSKTYTVRVSVYDEGGATSTGTEKKITADTFLVSSAKPKPPTDPAEGMSLEENPGGYVDIRWDMTDKHVDTIVITPTVTVDDKQKHMRPVTVDAATVVSHRFGPYRHGTMVQYSIMAVDFDGQESDALTVPSSAPHTIDNQAPIPQVPSTSIGTIDGTFKVLWTPKHVGDEGIFNIYTKSRKRVIHTFRDIAESTDRTTFTVIPEEPNREQHKGDNPQRADITPGGLYVVTLQIRDSIGNISDMRSNEVQARGISTLTNPGKVTDVQMEESIRTSRRVTVQWNAPRDFGTKDDIPVPASDMRYNVYYAKGDKGTYDTYQSLLNYEKHLISTPIRGDKELKTELTHLEPGTAYVVMVQTENVNDVSKLSYSDVLEIRTLGIIKGDITYQPAFISTALSKDKEVTPKGNITTNGVRYSIAPDDGLLTINGSDGTITIQKDIPSGTANQYTITLEKLGYETRTTTLWVYCSVSTPLESLLEDFTQERLIGIDTKTYRFTVRWENGARKDSTPPLSDIFYRIHYAWTLADGATDPTDLNTLQAMPNYHVKEISGKGTLPTMAIVKQYMGVNKKVYVYIQAVTKDGDGGVAKSTLSNIMRYQTKAGYTQIAAGWKHTIGLKKDGTVWAWGFNEHGQLGDDSNVDRYSPIQVKGLLDGRKIDTIASGWKHVVVRADDGTVWAWGLNEYGQLGDNTNTNSNSPIQVKGLDGKNIKAIAAGSKHTVALTGADTVWVWGRNNKGQLGDGSNIERHSPVRVKGLDGKNIKAIAAGVEHTVALTEDGTVWTWGGNNMGQLGNSSNTHSNIPIQVKGVGGTGYLTNIKAIAAGGYHTVALTGADTVLTWGRNKEGQLGVGGRNIIKSSNPVPVEGLDGRKIDIIASGWKHVVVRADDGTVWAWGLNEQDQLGDGSGVTESDRPVQMKEIDGRKIDTIASGWQHTVVLKKDGTVWALGRNHNGQLGDGTIKDKRIFVITDE